MKATLNQQQSNLNQLPAIGFKRASEILQFLPFGKTTLWQWSKDGRFPAPIKLSSNMTCWDVSQIHAWLNKHGQTAANDAENA